MSDFDQVPITADIDARIAAAQSRLAQLRAERAELAAPLSGAQLEWWIPVRHFSSREQDLEDLAVIRRLVAGGVALISDSAKHAEWLLLELIITETSAARALAHSRSLVRAAGGDPEERQYGHDHLWDFFAAERLGSPEEFAYSGGERHRLSHQESTALIDQIVAAAIARLNTDRETPLPEASREEVLGILAAEEEAWRRESAAFTTTR